MTRIEIHWALHLIAVHRFLASGLGESLKPSMFPAWTHTQAPHQAQILSSVYTPHLSLLPFCKHAADIWKKTMAFTHVMDFLLIIAFCPPRLQELLTACAGDYLHSFAAPLHHTMACNVHRGLVFIFSSVFRYFLPAYIMQTLFSPLFFLSVLCAATRDQR